MSFKHFCAFSKKRLKCHRYHATSFQTLLPLPAGGDGKTWQDGTVKTLYQKSKSSNGKRYIILHAGNERGFIEGADLVFSSSNKSSDYHDTMNAELFEKWFEEKLLMVLEEPSLIVIDNAPYHSRIREKSPVGSWTKQELYNWLREKNVDFPAHFLKAELLQLAKKNTPPKVYVVDALANEYGHKVLRLPPYHCQYNAIEMVWGISKNFYNDHITLTKCKDEDVLSVWKNALAFVTPEMWQKCIRKTNTIVRDALEKEHLIDDVRPLVITNSSDEDESSDEDNTENVEVDDDT